MIAQTESIKFVMKNSHLSAGEWLERIVLALAWVLPRAPWVLLAALANGALEELLFRGLFLGIFANL